MMHHYLPTTPSPDGPSPEVLFVDLDETLLDGTVNRLSDEELAVTPLIFSTVQQIQKTLTLGGKVILSTRNGADGMHRFFQARPETENWFSDQFGGNFDKSGPIGFYLQKNRIAAKRALFLDDTAGEREEVQRHVQGIRVAAPL